MDHAQSSPASAEISCVQPTSGLLWQRSGHPFVLVDQESKLCSGESKTSKKFDYCLCSSYRAVSFRFILYLVHELMGMMSHHTIFFVGLGSKSSE